MYAVEYTWINDPMPVTTRIMSAERGSRRNEKLTVKSPAVIQSKTICVSARASGSSATSFHTSTSATTNDARIDPHATPAAADLLMRRPKLAFTRKPANGSRGIRRSTSGSPFEGRE